MRGSDAWSSLALDLYEGPLESASIFLAGVALIHSRALDESSEDQKAVVVDLRQRMVISWLWNISSLLKFGPAVLRRVKLISIESIIIVADSTENYDRMPENGRSVMRQLARLLTFAVNWLPRDSVLGIIDKSLDTIDA
jgi:hypothetical protein